VLAHWNKSTGRQITPSGHIILIPSQQDIALTPECCILRRDAGNTNVIVFCLIRQNPPPTTLKVSSLTHHLPHSRSAPQPTIYHTQGQLANPPSTTLKVSSLTHHLPHSRSEGQLPNPPSTTLKVSSLTHHLPHSRSAP